MAYEFPTTFRGWQNFFSCLYDGYDQIPDDPVPFEEWLREEYRMSYSEYLNLEDYDLACEIDNGYEEYADEIRREIRKYTS